MQVLIKNDSSNGGNNQPPRNYFAFINEETNYTFFLGDEVFITKLDYNSVISFPCVSFPARQAFTKAELQISIESAERIFKGYLKSAHNQEFINSIPDEKTGPWKLIKMLYSELKTGFPETDYVRC